MCLNTHARISIDYTYGIEQEMLDPLKIDDQHFDVAQSVSFFECRLFLRGTFEEPIDLLARLHLLRQGPGGNAVKTWVVQGLGVIPLVQTRIHSEVWCLVAITDVIFASCCWFSATAAGAGA